ncbi:hypothetical protein [Streptacidiphilus sp. EB103A]|uniref:hypothetical protein n=1 Tax=Streptacidiphilus sp. EB103A TaxID=3156275 RepID=UPI00351550D8
MDQPTPPTILGRPSFGKQALPHDAPAFAFAHQLGRALAQIQQRETNPQAAARERFVLFIDQDQLLARFPRDHELRGLLEAVRLRGEAVDVVLNSPTPTRHA